MDFHVFANPPAAYGEVSFFWWQGDPVTREKLTWILDQLEDRHICGLQINYAHGDSGGRSYGLTLPSQPSPLSEAWWELVTWFAGEANRRGMAVSLSDYTLSGPGQQSYTDRVLRENPRFHGQLLARPTAGSPLDPSWYDVRPLAETAEGVVVAARVPFSLNPMEPGVGEAIADAFFGAFERHLPGKCGSGVNFFFSDELEFGVRGLLWCDDFPQVFAQMKGYDLLPRLGDLFETGSRGVKTRLDYADVAVRLSEERYLRPVYAWHQQRGMIFGCDHGGCGLDVTEFGDYFRTMRWNQGPGNDQPRLESRILKNKVNSSIAHLYERPRTWLEGFYGSGWQTSSADVADAVFRNFATGQNLLSLHGLYYSTHGGMWEWAPPCNHHHMPYWAEMGTLLGCTQRLSWLLTQGRHYCDVAIVYPVAAVEADPVRGKRAVDCAFAAGETLYAHGVDFDFIDFESVERADLRGETLCVAGEAYRCVVVPDMQAVRYGMLEKLAAWAEQGGLVVVLGEAPTASDRAGEDDPQLDALVEEIISRQPPLPDASALLELLQRRWIPDVLLPEGSWFQHRVLEDAAGEEHLYYVYGVLEGTECGFHADGRPVLLDPFGGRRYALPAGRREGEITYLPMETRFGGLMLVLFDDGSEPIEPLYTGDYTDILFQGEWESLLLPTLDNRFGDYRLPAAPEMLGAEARFFSYRLGDEAAWRHGQDSEGIYFHLLEGEADEAVLAALEAPDRRFKPYAFSMKTGVIGDAGYQASYHGLKGRLSDDFLALGRKTVLRGGSDSRYDGEGPYYLFTHLRVEETCRVCFLVGDPAPPRVWIDHQSCSLEPRELARGLHPLLLKYDRGCRTHFVARRVDAPDYRQETPLAMRWYGDPAILPFDAFPQWDGAWCELRFTTPPGLRGVILPGDVEARIWVEGRELTRRGLRWEPGAPVLRSAEGVLQIRCENGRYGTALLDGPVGLDCGPGILQAGRPIEEQGLASYAGGVGYTRCFRLEELQGRVRLRLGAVDCAAQVWVNGRQAGVLVAPPYDLDITEYVTEGENQIQVIIHNTLRNFMQALPTVYLPGRQEPTP